MINLTKFCIRFIIDIGRPIMFRCNIVKASNLEPTVLVSEGVSLFSAPLAFSPFAQRSANG